MNIRPFPIEMPYTKQLLEVLHMNKKYNVIGLWAGRHFIDTVLLEMFLEKKSTYHIGLIRNMEHLANELLTQHRDLLP